MRTVYNFIVFSSTYQAAFTIFPKTAKKVKIILKSELQNDWEKSMLLPGAAADPMQRRLPGARLAHAGRAFLFGRAARHRPYAVARDRSCSRSLLARDFLQRQILGARPKEADHQRHHGHTAGDENKHTRRAELAQQE